MKALVPTCSEAALYCAREYLLTMPGVMMNHLSLATVFENIEQNRASKAYDLQRACVGSQIELLDERTAKVSLITLTEPGNSQPSLGRVSYFSLLGSKLLGVLPGQSVSVNVLGRPIKYHVLSVKNDQQIEGGD